MKKMSLLKFTAMGIVITMSMSSCGTLFTSSKQDIVFTGQPDTSLYHKGKKLGKIGEGGSATVKLKKSLSSQTVVAKKEGFYDTPVEVGTTFNPVSVLNLLNIIAWAVDLGTGKCCKYDDGIVAVEMRPDNSVKGVDGE